MFDIIFPFDNGHRTMDETALHLYAYEAGVEFYSKVKGDPTYSDTLDELSEIYNGKVFSTDKAIKVLTMAGYVVKEIKDKEKEGCSNE